MVAYAHDATIFKAGGRKNAKRMACARRTYTTVIYNDARMCSNKNANLNKKLGARRVSFPCAHTFSAAIETRCNFFFLFLWSRIIFHKLQSLLQICIMKFHCKYDGRLSDDDTQRESRPRAVMINI